MVGKPKNLEKCEDFSIYVNGLPIQRVKTLKILGITFDENLTFNTHCSIIHKKCYQKLSVLYPYKYMLSYDNKCILVNALILSIISYGCIIWGKTLCKANIKLIDGIIKNCAKYVFGKRKFDSVTSDVCNRLEWLFFKSKILYESLIFCYKITFSNKNALLHNYLDFSHKISVTRGKEYKTPVCDDTKKCEITYKFFAVKHWLQLPDYIVLNNSNFVNFKKKLLSHILSIQSKELSNTTESTCDYSCIDAVVNYVYENDL